MLAAMAGGKLTLTDCKTLWDEAGSARAVMENRHDIRAILPSASERLTELLSSDLDFYCRRAEEEQEWAERNKVRIVLAGQAEYPTRLSGCLDAPLALFTRGGADYNARQVLSIVGTRKVTPYGQDVISAMVKELKEACPSLLIISGLAYGVDIAAHRAAMANDMATVGVVAHGQDTLYPSLHRTDANRMVTGCGGVVTEFFRGTRPEARNFLQRNRIIAGMGDATLVVESAERGGSLVTARIANEYGREVMAVPGPVNAELSKGCNELIRCNKASLVSSASDILELMQWENEAVLEKARRQGIERSIFPDLSREEEELIENMKRMGDSKVNDLAVTTGMPVNKVSSLLFALEMKGMVKAMAGNIFHLIG